MVDLIIKNLNCKIFRKLCKKSLTNKLLLITVCKLYMFGIKAYWVLNLYFAIVHRKMFVTLF